MKTIILQPFKVHKEMTLLDIKIYKALDLGKLITHLHGLGYVNLHLTPPPLIHYEWCSFQCIIVSKYVAYVTILG